MRFGRPRTGGEASASPELPFRPDGTSRWDRSGSGRVSPWTSRAIERVTTYQTVRYVAAPRHPGCLAWTAGSRWRIEECFAQAKNEAGLDDYQVRSYRAWFAHITLSMLALAWLTATRAEAAAEGDPGDGAQHMIALTVPEIRRLLVHLLLQHTQPAEHAWTWSHRRRRRRHQARISHYRRRGDPT
jgi:hypothetical protein